MLASCAIIGNKKNIMPLKSLDPVTKNQTLFFYVSGMTCISCSGSIESALLQKLKTKSIKLKQFHVDLTTPDPKLVTVTIESHTNKDKALWNELQRTINDVGFICKDFSYRHQHKSKSSVSDTNRFDALAFSQKMFRSHWFLGILGTTTGLALLIAFLASGGIPLAALIPIAIFSTLLTAILGARSYYDAWKKLTHSHTLTMDTLFSISTLTIIGVSIAAFFVPWLPMMFEAGLLIYGFRHVGLAIEESLKKKINHSRFQDRAPAKVKRCLRDTKEETNLEQIEPGDVIEIGPGELIPIDGYCDNDSMGYDTIITGAILPRALTRGEKVLAGMRLAEKAPSLKIKVMRPAQQSYLVRLDENIAQSMREKAPLEIITQKLLTYFIPVVIGLAILSGLVIGTLFSPALAIQCAISVLVSACPCTLGLVIPLAVKTGMHKAIEYGAHFKNSKVLQQAEQIDVVVFDLNGTLTTGVPVVKNCHLIQPEISNDELLKISSTLERHSTHPIAQAICAYYPLLKNESELVSGIDTSDHAGITGEIKGVLYHIGGAELMKNKGVDIEKVEQQYLEAGDHLIYVARGDELLGTITVTDPLRPDAKATVQLLKKMGKEIHLCTGADEKTAQRYAKTLGINRVYANCVATTTPEKRKAKPAYIKFLKKKKHKVAMIGDAGNDATALAASDLGFAVRSKNSDELTQQQADIITHNDLRSIANAFIVSQQTNANIKQNLWMSLGYNLATVCIAGGLLLAIGLTMNPAIGAALMIFQASIILGNVYYFKQKKLPHHNQDLVINTSHKNIKNRSPNPKESLSRLVNKHATKDNSHLQAILKPPSILTTHRQTKSSSFWSVISCCSQKDLLDQEEIIPRKSI